MSLALIRSRSSPSVALWFMFLALSLIWGSSFLFIKIGLNEGLPPLTLVSYRLWIAVLFLALVVRLTGGRLPRDRDVLASIAFLGVINVAIPFSLITWGELWITSALASILNGLVPLFTIVIAAAFLADEAITVNRLTGLVIGFAGALLLFSPHLGGQATGESADPGMEILGQLAVAGASLAYAMAGVYIRTKVSGARRVDGPGSEPRALTPVEIALPQGIVAAVIVSVLAALVERGAPTGVILPPGPSAWFAVSWIGILGSGVAYMLLFRLIAAWGPTRTSLVTYAMPVVGIILGVIVLRERIGWAELAGTALIIGGIALVNSRVGQRRLLGRATSAAGRPGDQASASAGRGRVAD